MKMEQFSLTKHLQNKSRKVITRRGNPVRIICTDRKHGSDNIPIVFLEECNGGEFLLSCKYDGRSENYDTPYDLFFENEENTDEFEESMIAFAHEMFDHLINVKKEVNIEEWKNKLLELAKKELEPNILKNLPKWKYKKDSIPLLHDSFILNKYGCIAKSPSGAQVNDVWVLEIDNLVNLPKIE